MLHQLLTLALYLLLLDLVKVGGKCADKFVVIQRAVAIDEQGTRCVFKAI
jgi:hypothetical protein